MIGTVAFTFGLGGHATYNGGSGATLPTGVTLTMGEPMDAGLGRSAAVETALRDLLRDRGVGAWRDPKVVAEALQAAIPREPGRIELIVATVQIGIVAELADMPARDSIRESQLAQRLVFERYYSDSDARFAVETWARVLHEAASVPEAIAEMHAQEPVPAAVPAAPATPPVAPAYPDRPPAPTHPGAEFGPPAVPKSSAWEAPARASRRAKRRGVDVKTIVVIVIVLFALANWATQCSNNSSGDGALVSGDTVATIEGSSASVLEEYAKDTFGYDEAVAVDASETVQGLGGAPAAIQAYVARYAADPANAKTEWLVVRSYHGDGYVLLRPDGDGEHALLLSILRTSDGAYHLAGPLASKVPSH
jgi:hypothetical protein